MVYFKRCTSTLPRLAANPAIPATTKIPNYPQTVGPILRTVSFRVVGTLSSRLYCTGRYDGKSRVLIHKVWWISCTHAPTPFTALHCAALHCRHYDVCMKDRPFGDASLSPRYLNISIPYLPPARYHTLRVCLINGRRYRPSIS